MTIIESLPEGHVEGHPIERRMVRFDWSATPAHWVPGDPFASHVINVLHLLLPAGERWFIDVVNEARPKVRDQELQEAIKPFIQQESWHAQAHAYVLEQLDSQGIDTAEYTDRLEAMFHGLLGVQHPSWPAPLQRWMERRNLAAVAAIEHFTAVLGQWILNNTALDDAGADPQMLDLLRWHGAEEVEHRALVFDVYRAVGGRWLQRATAMLTVAPTLTGLWIAGVRYLIGHDPAYRGKAHWRDFFQSARARHLPRFRDVFRQAPAYMKPSYHPSQEFSTLEALEYIARSPAAQSAAARREASAGKEARTGDQSASR